MNRILEFYRTIVRFYFLSYLLLHFTHYYHTCQVPSSATTIFTQAWTFNSDTVTHQHLAFKKCSHHFCKGNGFHSFHFGVTKGKRLVSASRSHSKSCLITSICSGTNEASSNTLVRENDEIFPRVNQTIDNRESRNQNVVISWNEDYNDGSMRHSSFDDDKSTDIVQSYAAHSSSSTLTLVPLSREPIILMSSEPLLSFEECKTLLKFFQNGCSIPAGIDEEINDSKSGKDLTYDSENMEGFRLYHYVQDLIDELTMCPSHDGEPYFPRYIQYVPSDEETPLLQDGMHVDTNNGQLFRHITVLLYLSDNENINELGGATTFPLAKPLWNSPDDYTIIDSSWHLNFSNIHNNHNTRNGMEQCANEIQAANTLIQANVHHTRLQTSDITTDLMHAGRMIERLGEKCFTKQSQPHQYQHQSSLLFTSSASYGIRIVPKVGYVCVVANMNDDGLPDPLTFHAGETLYKDRNIPVNEQDNERKHVQPTKDLLTFFKEIPISNFNSINEFKIQVRNSRQRLLDRYYQ